MTDISNAWIFDEFWTKYLIILRITPNFRLIAPIVSHHFAVVFVLQCHLRRAILEIIASGIAKTENDLEHFFKCTLLYLDNKMSSNSTQSTRLGTRVDSADIQPGNSIPVKDSIQFLEEYEFIRMHFNESKEEKYFVATRLGYACLGALNYMNMH